MADQTRHEAPVSAADAGAKADVSAGEGCARAQMASYARRPLPLPAAGGGRLYRLLRICRQWFGTGR
ncbi:hypothetical protein CEW87_05670 [Parazoarcus communis]|uniref:Uncharacterized protein n=1 Tax=Parazoarcus communis TaxID=41977 RepID=A0A2U8GYX4_9RHOO|nr:hypothetical protein [Parazoarcus communis]AWI78892.1 hypothetical protein CEW87_05670 [Parazoarcus communis]